MNSHIIQMHIFHCISHVVFFTDCSPVGKDSTCNAGDPGSIPGLGRSPGERNGHRLQLFLPGESHGHRCLEGCSPWGHKVGHDLATKPPTTTVISVAPLDGQGLFKTARTEISSSVALSAFFHSCYFSFFLLHCSICLPECAL